MRFSFDGHEIDHEVRGDGERGTLVFLHGLAGDRWMLHEACEAIAAEAGWRRVYLDLPGHGASTGNPRTASADHLIVALATLIAEIGGAAPRIVAHSYGGYLAQGLVRAVPGLGGLFLACPIVEPDFGKRRLPAARVAARDADLTFADDDERIAFEGEVVVQTAALLDVFRRVVQPAHLACDRDVVAVTREYYVMSRLYMNALAQFDRPVTIVAGRDDHWAGFEDAINLVRAFRRCDLRVIPDAGQLLPLEAPEIFQGMFGEWLKRV